LSLLLAAAAPGELRAQQRVVSDLPPGGLVARGATITLRTAAGQDVATDRLALFIDRTDVSALVRWTGTGWTYDAGALPLSSGGHELTAWLIGADGAWREALRQTFRVPGPLGIDSVGVEPALDVGLKSRLASAFQPESPGERETYNDLVGQLGFDAQVLRYDGLRLRAAARFLGSSQPERALRFSELGGDAPHIDLSSWSAQLSGGPLQLAAGNVIAGDARHLIQRFSSRGASVGLSGARVQVSAAALHGAQLVGWDDLVGLGEPDHRIFTGTIGAEALSRPGALRVELTALDGSVLPRSGINRGAVVDAETSSGYALRAQSQLLDRRVRLEAGYTRSTFDNPDDPELAGDTTLVPIVRETRSARYLQTSLEALRGLRLGAGRSARLTLGFQHERVDPLFRTVAGYTRPDQLQNRWEARADVAGIAISGSHTRARDNLDGIASILTSLTHRTGLDVSVPLASVLRGSAWLPQLRWRIDRTHQFGEGVPVNGGFSGSHVPDQVSLERTASLDVRLGLASFGYRFGLSEQDNRQAGRENADLERGTHGFLVQAAPRRALSLNGEVSWIRASSAERAEADATRKLGGGVHWAVLRESVIALQYSDTRSDVGAVGSFRLDRTWSIQGSSPVPGLSAMGAEALVRFARATSRATVPRSAAVERASWMVDAGFNLSLP
jgi:hypothetical protein